MVDRNDQSTGYTKNNTLIIVVVSVLVVAIAMAATVFFLNKSPAVVTVNGEKITKDSLYEAMYDSVGSATLDNMIAEMLVEQEAKKQDISIADEDVQNRLAKIIEQNFASEEEFMQALMMYNMSLEEMKKNIKNELIMTEILGKDIEIEEAEMEEFFADNRAHFDSEEQVNVRHILLDSEEDAVEVLAELNSGADFAKLAKEKSVDPGSKDKGGALGFVKRAGVVEEFADVAFTLPENEISGVVKSNYGYHILQVLEKEPAKPAVYEDVKEEIRELVLQSKVNEKAGSWMMGLRGNAQVEYANEDS